MNKEAASDRSPDSEAQTRNIGQAWHPKWCAVQQHTTAEPRRRTNCLAEEGIRKVLKW